MPFDPGLAQRLEDLIPPASGLIETRLFGGVGYLLQGNMCIGIYKDLLILRVGAATAKELLKDPHIRPMDITGRPMKGWVMVEPEGIEDDHDLTRYLNAAIQFVATLPPK